MNYISLLNAISFKSSEFSQELRSIHTYSVLDPQVAVSKSRQVLEKIVNQVEEAQGDNLSSKIQSLSAILPESVVAYMHFIRKLGNSAVHSSEPISEQTAKDVKNILIQLTCWHLKIDPNNLKTGCVRYFIADPVHNTWGKIAILSEDGVLYSEYLTFMKPTKFRLGGFDYSTFKASDYRFGEREHGHAYQSMREVSADEVLSYKLTAQENWVERYLKEIGVTLR
ncbi:TPA: DUF4145 domain-containing protein [Vibrio parahaemolyticus]|nr:DUF4145 domain-containing protein [Vibrio parahaemolyticus]